LNSPREHFVRKSKEALTRLVSFGESFIKRSGATLVKLRSFREKRGASGKERRADTEEAGRVRKKTKRPSGRKTQ